MINLVLLSTLTIGQLPVDKVAHFGLSWVINHTVYSVCEKVIEKKVPCLITSILTTSAIGISKEIMDGNRNTGREHAKDLTADGLGILGSSLVIGINF